MALRGPAGAFNLRVGTDKDAQAIKMLQYAAPWLLWILGLPTAAFALRMARRFWGHPSLLSWGMFLGVVVLTALVWKVTSARGMDRVHHVANMAAVMGWLWAVVALGPNGALGILYLIGGLIGNTAWNVRYTKHQDKVLDAIPSKTTSSGPKAIDMGYVMRVIASRAPAVRTAMEGAGNVVPALKRPWEPAGELTSGSAPASFGNAVAGGDGKQERVMSGLVIKGKVIDTDPKPVWERIARNWKVFTTQRPRGRDLNGVRLVPLELTPTRIKTKAVLQRGHHTPKMIEDSREDLAIMNGFHLSQVVVRGSETKHGEVLVDWVLHDTLSDTMEWTGIDGQWRSILDGPLVYGMYDDGKFAELWHPSIPGRKNLTHLAFEGMPGSGKSNVARLAIAWGVRIYDVVDWCMDPMKAAQTFGPVSNAVDWFATTSKEAVDLIEFVVEVVTARADYLGINGYDEWEPGCGIPFLRVWLEEGNLTADLLGAEAERVGNLARSAGVSLNGSFQRMHHASVPTGLRAVFSESMSFGCNKPGDAFILPDDLANAGADPSVWKDKHAGKHYWASKIETLERQLIPVRSFKVSPVISGETCDGFGDEKHERIRREYPDWFEMLNKLDTNGVYKNRTTGPNFRKKMLEAKSRRESRDTAKNNARTSEPAAAPEPDTEPINETGDDVMGTESGRPAERDIHTDPAYLEGLKKPEPTAEKLAKEVEDMGGNAEWLDAAKDTSLDSQEIPIPHPDMVLVFNQPPMPDKQHDKGPSLAHLIAYLAEKGPGWKFQPHEVAGDCMEITGKSAGWYRTMLTTEVPAMGLTEWDPEKGTHRVAKGIRNEDTRRRVEAYLSKIPAGA